jgi:hypothetical protein
MADSFVQKTDFCPLCGATPLEEPTSETQSHGFEEGGPLGAVNATICPNCAVNLHIYNPLVRTVYGKKNTFSIVIYPATADEWDRKSAVALFQCLDDHPVSHKKPIAVSYNALSDKEQHLCRELSKHHSIDSIEQLTEVPCSPISADYADTLTATRFEAVPLDQTAISSLLSRIPRPTVTDHDSLYTTDTQSLKEVCSTSVSRTAQSGLEDF